MEHITVIHLMRHGEVHNPEGVLYGRLPGYHLSDLGRKMTETTGQYLFDNGFPIQEIVASPLERAQESAEGAARLFGLPIKTDERLIESANLFEGQRINGNRKSLLNPRYYPRYWNPITPSWCEPYRDQAYRIRDAVAAALHRQHSNCKNTANTAVNLSTDKHGKPLAKHVLMVSHQLPIWCFRLFIEGKMLVHNPNKRQCSLASLTSFTFAGGTLLDWDYTEPAANLLAQATDMVPGTSAASVNRG